MMKVKFACKQCCDKDDPGEILTLGCVAERQCDGCGKIVDPKCEDYYFYWSEAK